MRFLRIGRNGGSALPLMSRQEQVPLGDAVRVADECRGWQLLRRTRNAEQLEASLVREPVSLALVNFLRGPHEVFPRVAAPARTGHHVVKAALFRAQRAAG